MARLYVCCHSKKKDNDYNRLESTEVTCHPHFAISTSGAGEAVRRVVSAAGDSHREEARREDVRMGQREEGLHIRRTPVHSRAVGVHPGFESKTLGCSLVPGHRLLADCIQRVGVGYSSRAADHSFGLGCNLRTGQEVREGEDRRDHRDVLKPFRPWYRTMNQWNRASIWRTVNGQRVTISTSWKDLPRARESDELEGWREPSHPVRLRSLAILLA
jgi:hypothetical protein